LAGTILIKSPPSSKRLLLPRRALLRAAAGLAATLAAPAIIRSAAGQSRFAANPFSLGVASGYPTADGVVLWTRLAPDPLNGGGMPPEKVPVEWQIAADARMDMVVQRGIAIAEPESAHSVHIEVSGLDPGRWYWYRFRAGGEASAIARTRTAPAMGAALDSLRFAFASCQQYEHGYYTAYRHMAEEDLDLVVHLGDYIYELSWGGNLVRSHGTPECTTLADYRNRYALYKGDADLQAAHAAFPWLAIWDDHEVDNDYANDRSEQLDDPAAFLARRAAGYKAFYEHMPLPHRMAPDGPNMRIYERVGFGNLATFNLLDDRQYRSPQVCPREGRGGAAFVEHCPERLDPDLSLLGWQQEHWLTDGLARSTSRWNLIAQQTLMAQVDRRPGPGAVYWTDNWDGTPAARARLLNAIAEQRPSNPVVIGGDVHAFWVTDLKTDFDKAKAPIVATEFVGTSITSQAPAQERFEAMLPDNPHVRFVNSAHRGYVRMALTPDQCTADLRAVSTVRKPEAKIRTLASFVVENGRPGAVPA
jgi:alkaline phosphatase D